MTVDDMSPDNCHVNGRVKGLYQDSMMTSFRTGAVMHLIEHPYVTENQINQRGGWTEDGGAKVIGNAPTRMSKYIRPCDYAVMRAGFA